MKSYFGLVHKALIVLCSYAFILTPAVDLKTFFKSQWNKMKTHRAELKTFMRKSINDDQNWNQENNDKKNTRAV